MVSANNIGDINENSINTVILMVSTVNIGDTNGIYRAINGTFMAIKNGGFPYFN